MSIEEKDEVVEAAPAEVVVEAPAAKVETEAKPADGGELVAPTAEEKAAAEEDADKAFEKGYKGEADDAPAPKPAFDEAFVNGLIGKEAGALREDFGKLRDTLFGKIGEANRTLKALQTTKAGGVKLTKEALKRVSEQYGDELAEALSADLSEANLGGGAAPAISEETLKPFLENLRRDITMEAEGKALKRQHRDFYDVIKTPEFEGWLEQQPEDVRKEWPLSMDSDWLGERMTDFKKGQELAKKREVKQNRLIAAVNPQGSKPAPIGVSDEAAFEQGFKQARSGSR